MADPFNQVLRNKLSLYKRRTDPDNIIPIIERMLPRARRTKEEAFIVAKPLLNKERKKLAQKELEEEDQRLVQRAELMAVDHISEETVKLFEA